MVSSTLPGPSGFGRAELRKKSQSASEDVPINEAWLRSKELNASIIDHLFEQLDKDKNGTLSRIEVIKSLRSNKEVQALLRLPSRIRQEDGTRDAFESVFQAIDRDDSKSISKAEWHQYCLGALGSEARSGVLRLSCCSVRCSCWPWRHASASPSRRRRRPPRACIRVWHGGPSGSSAAYLTCRPLLLPPDYLGSGDVSGE